MLEFICYFMPSFLSLCILNNMDNRMSIKTNIIYYGVFVSINNFLGLFIVCMKHMNDSINFDIVNFNFCFKYLLVTILFSIVTPIFVNAIRQRIKLNLEVKNNEKNR